MAKARRNRLLRQMVFGDKAAARRLRKNRSSAHDVIPLETVLKSALDSRMGRSGIVVPKSGLLVAEIDEKDARQKVLGGEPR